MNQEQFWNEFSKLPPTAQKLIEELMQFLQTKYNARPDDENSQIVENNSIRDAAFIGMWSDRSDIVDSTEFVRQLRTSEWGIPGD